VSRLPPVPTVTEADLKQVDIQEGYQVDLAPGSAVPCVVSFAPGQERRVYFAGGLGMFECGGIGKVAGGGWREGHSCLSSWKGDEGGSGEAVKQECWWEYRQHR
jgi:hypothetical protein